MDRVQAHRYFQAHNHERIHRLLQLAPQRHSLILELLPFLFHTNAKLLPGYVSDDTPAGLIDYRPDKSTLDRAKQLEKSFRYRRRALRRYPLRGLYLINPHGLLGYPQQPRFELWLLFSNLLNSEQQQLLKRKIEAVCNWARSAGLDLQPRLLSVADLLRGSLSSWDRDQFYSSGLVLAGSQPYWWFTSPEEDQNYADSVITLQSQRMLNQVSLLDFGAVDSFAADSLFSITADVLRDSLDKGNQLLSLHYLDACLQRPSDMALSPLFKQQIYRQQTEIAASDLHYLRLQKLEQVQAQARPELREAFYQQSHEKLSKPVRQAIVPWRRSFVYKLAENWGWDQDKLTQLDQATDDISHRRRAFDALGRHSRQVLQHLQDFNRQQHLHGDTVLSALKQTHRLRHQPALDQVPCLPLALRPDSNADRLYLSRFHDDLRWYLSRQPLTDPSRRALFEHDSLLQVLAFAVGNRLLSRSNWLSVSDQLQQVTTASIVEMSQQLLRTPLADTDLTDDPKTLAAAETLNNVWLFINLQQQPSDKLARQGLQLSSKLNDPLNYSSYRQCLVLSVDGLVQSGHGLFYSFRFSGEQAVLETLRYLLSWLPAAHVAIDSWCPTAIFGQAISQRVTDLVQQVFAHSQRHNKQGRLLLNIAERPYELAWQQQQVSYKRRPLSRDIWQSLAENQTGFEALLLDRYLDKDGLLNTLLAYQADDRISVFIYLEQNTIICYLLDEFGNLVRQQYQQLTESTLIAHLQVFLSEIKNHNRLSHLRFYRLSREQQQWQTTPLAVPHQPRGYLPLKVIMASPALDADCTVICGQQQFQGQADDPALFAPVHKLIQGLRQQHQHSYPVYINSLRFNDETHHPAALFMQQKQRLENLFNPD